MNLTSHDSFEEHVLRNNKQTTTKTYYKLFRKAFWGRVEKGPEKEKENKKQSISLRNLILKY